MAASPYHNNQPQSNNQFSPTADSLPQHSIAARVFLIFLLLVIVVTGALIITAAIPHNPKVSVATSQTEPIPTVSEPHEAATIITCVHEWDAETGQCQLCSFPCPHSYYNPAGRCEICAYQCKHLQMENDRCTVCGFECAHSEWEDGYCVACHTPCSHSSWSNGQCLTCGMTCQHPAHTRTNPVCTVCDTPTRHQFENGQCVCGLQTHFVTEPLSGAQCEPNEKSGQIETVWYNTKYYDVKNSIIIEKSMLVYLPADYDINTSARYPVLLLLHGGGGVAEDWLLNPMIVNETSMRTAYGKDIFDNLFADENIDPAIVVSVSTTYDGADISTNQLANEIRSCILPYIADHYRTYAQDGSEAELQKAREHIGIMGVSNGSLYAILSGLEPNFDLIGNYGLFSGCTDFDNAIAALNRPEWTELPIVSMYFSVGTHDMLNQPTCQHGYNMLISSEETRALPGSNVYYGEITGGHGWDIWFASAYNALQVMFQRPLFNSQT